MIVKKISNRLKWLSSYVTNRTLADIGTDHGIVPIYLLKEGKLDKAIAMDINEGPLKHAKANVAENGLDALVDFRLSNGFEKLYEKEVDSVIIAGMGGELICNIILNGMKTAKTVDEVIISPHSEWKKVRRFLMDNGFSIIKEDMLFEEGKFYLMIKCKYIESSKKETLSFSNDSFEKAKSLGLSKADATNLFFAYGEKLLLEKNSVLKDMLLIKKEKMEEVKSKVKASSNEALESVNKELNEINTALKFFEL